MDDTCVKMQVPLEAVRYDPVTGLVPVVVQAAASGLVLMVAYANREALKRTFGTGEAWFWSRSRQSYWHKGETSGNVMRVVELRVDCDGDSVLYLVEPAGPACHTGEDTCFYRQMVREEVRNDATTVPLQHLPRQPEDESVDVADPATHAGAFGEALDTESLEQLWQIISSRWAERPQGSYTTYLFAQGIDKVAKKVGEEATEVVIAAKNAASGDAGKNELCSESADLLYHLFVLWRAVGVSPNDVLAMLRKRQ